jgi:hypothetical protein
VALWKSLRALMMWRELLKLSLRLMWKELALKKQWVLEELH